MKAKNCGLVNNIWYLFSASWSPMWFFLSKHVFEVPMAFCQVSQERTSNSIGFNCPEGCSGEKEKPTCGSDGHIYRSECELRLLNCG